MFDISTDNPWRISGALKIKLSEHNEDTRPLGHKEYFILRGTEDVGTIEGGMVQYYKSNNSWKKLNEARGG